MAHRVWWRPSPKGAHELPRLCMRLELRRHPKALRHEPTGADEQPARRSSVHEARKPPERGRSVAHWRSDDTTAPGAGAPEREGVLLVSL